MIHRLRRGIALLLALLGSVHVAFTFVGYRALSPNAVWFAGAGIALILLALMNLSSADSRASLPMLRGANALCAVYAAAAVVAVPEPQAFFGLALVVTLLVLSFVRGSE